MTMMTNCDPRIEAYMEAVETGKVEASKDVKALMKHVRKCFETEDIYVDQQQLTDYLGLARYFPYDEVFPWQQFVIGLHDCTVLAGEWTTKVAGSVLPGWARCGEKDGQ